MKQKPHKKNQPVKRARYDVGKYARAKLLESLGFKPEDYCSMTELAQETGISIRTLYRMEDDKIFSADIRVHSRMILFHKEKTLKALRDYYSRNADAFKD